MTLRPILLFVFVVAGCKSHPTAMDGTVCTLELGIVLTPRDTVVAAGGQFRPELTLRSCGGTRILTDSFTWTSADPSVAAVEKTSGLITATKAGVTSISVSGERYGRLGEVHITVH